MESSKKKKNALDLFVSFKCDEVAEKFEEIEEDNSISDEEKPLEIINQIRDTIDEILGEEEG